MFGPAVMAMDLRQSHPQIDASDDDYLTDLEQELQLMPEDRASMVSATNSEAGAGSVVDGSPVPSADLQSIDEGHNGGQSSASGKPAIGELRAVAGNFTAAFSSALSELEDSRRQIEAGSARIMELEESVRSINRSLDEEVETGHRREQEHLQETGRLKERIQETESQRDLLQEKTRKQERMLEERSSELSELFGRIEEFKTALEERSAADERRREEFASEKNALRARLDELQGLYDEAGGRLKSQQRELEECNREIETLRSRVEGLLGELEEKTAEAARLDRQVQELQGEIEVQGETMRQQSESHAAVCEELNARVAAVGSELEMLQTSHADLKAHAENLEKLNQALHESSITEQRVHRQQIDNKAAEIESLRSRLDASGETSPPGPEGAQESAQLEEYLRELESRLEEVTAQNRELGKRAEESERLKTLNERLRLALRKSRERATEQADGPQDPQSLQAQLQELQAALEAAQSRERALEQDITALRDEASKHDAGQSGAVRADEETLALRREVEQLRAALSAAEDRRGQPQAASTPTPGAEAAGAVLQIVPDRPRDAAEPGRSRFITRIDEMLAGAEGSGPQHSLMYILLDNFMAIRDEVGVVESESVVREVGELIESACAGEDEVARFGDCTFTILCRATTVEKAEEKAEGIRKAVEAKIFEQGGRSLVTTASIGVCSIRRNDTRAKDIISRADLACESARLSGGNRVIRSSAIADEVTIRGNDEDHRDMVLKTIEEQRIRTYYQPISSLREESLVHFEVLIRLVDESGDMILPGEFFAMAEGAGYSSAVDRIVVENTLKVISESSDQRVKYFIKLTRQSVTDDELPAWIRQKIGEYGVAPQLLVFEIAEHILQSDLGKVSALTGELREIGCQTAIEHYRMATNLQHLKHVHADYLKIDKGLTGSLEGKGDSLAKVTEIMDLARNNNYITIAEGVETPGCLAVLWELGITMAQGYFIQAPAAVREYLGHDVETDSQDEDGRAKFSIS